jgi:hypothetical protein
MLIFYCMTTSKRDSEPDVKTSTRRDSKRDCNDENEDELDSEKMVKKTDISVKDNQKQLLAMSTCK